MATLTRIPFLALVAALLAVGGSAGAADAGWVTIRNDTNRVIVVQGTVGGIPARRCKPVRLLPGETVREFHPSTTLKVEVFDGQNPSRSLYSGTLSVRPEAQSFAVGTDGRSVQVTELPKR